MRYFIGVDVGTASVRSALVQENGKLVSTAKKEITIWNPKPNFYQQSSVNIWNAVIYTIKTVLCEGKVDPSDVKGLGFDATCSLVIADKDCNPVSVCPTGNSDCDIVMWMDHRAVEEASIINATKHEVLKYTGGTISLEMEPPKLLWLKKKLADQCWSKAYHMFDLCDFLTWRATGSFTRSLCAMVAKWTYTKDGGFSKEFYTQIGLEDLCENNFDKIGSSVQEQGASCGSGLTARAAEELGLKPHTPVSVGIIDAHCAAIGCLACRATDPSVSAQPMQNRLLLIAGTSNCHLIMSEGPILVPGVWGPLWSAVIPGYWAAEGGQSAAGKLIDFVVETHPAYQGALKEANIRNQHISDYLFEILQAEAKQKQLSDVALLTKDVHIWPDFHGNRSPLADNSLTGMMTGLTLQTDEVNLAVRYLATVQALAYGTQHIISVMKECGHTPEAVYICGGFQKNKLYIQTHANVTGLPMVVPEEKETVLVGAAILGATAAGLCPTIQECMEQMGGPGAVIMPIKDLAGFYSRKYKVFLEMYADQKKYMSYMDT